MYRDGKLRQLILIQDDREEGEKEGEKEREKRKEEVLLIQYSCQYSYVIDVHVYDTSLVINNKNSLQVTFSPEYRNSYIGSTSLSTTSIMIFIVKNPIGVFLVIEIMYIRTQISHWLLSSTADSYQGKNNTL